MSGLRRWLIGSVVAAVLAAATPVHAETPKTLVSDAQATVAKLVVDPDFENLKGLLARARGVVVVPALYKAGLIIMTDEGMEAMLADKIEIGGDASVAAGPVGINAKAAAASTDFDQDIYAYGTGQGLFAGVAVEGAILIPDEDTNQSYYGEAATTREIVQAGTISNGDADGLRAALAGIDDG